MQTTKLQSTLKSSTPLSSQKMHTTTFDSSTPSFAATTTDETSSDSHPPPAVSSTASPLGLHSSFELEVLLFSSESFKIY